MKFINSNYNITSMVNITITEWDESEVTAKNTFMEEVESYSIFKIANLIMIYWLPVLIPIGLVGNTLSFLVMVKPNNRKMSTCIYMATISINDNIMMLCNSMPLVRLGLTICVVMSLYFLVWHRVHKIKLLFVWAAPVKA